MRRISSAYFNSREKAQAFARLRESRGEEVFRMVWLEGDDGEETIIVVSGENKQYLYDMITDIKNSLDAELIKKAGVK